VIQLFLRNACNNLTLNLGLRGFQFKQSRGPMNIDTNTALATFALYALFSLFVSSSLLLPLGVR
jgi:hypothetical protein